MGREKLFGFKRGHASHSGSRDGLAINIVSDVTGCEYAWH
jgi:hypothetical protein